MDDEKIVEPTVIPTPETMEPNIVINEPIIDALAPVPAALEPLTTHPSPITATEISAPPPIINTPDPPIVIEQTPLEPRPIPAPVPVVPPAPEPQLIPHSSPVNAKFDVTLLTDEQLKAAAALYTKRNQAEISRKGVAKRQETMELNLREIVDYLSLNNGSPLPRIAKHTNITLGTTSKYLRQLNAKGKIRAEGWGKTRRYYLK